MKSGFTKPLQCIDRAKCVPIIKRIASDDKVKGYIFFVKRYMLNKTKKILTNDVATTFASSANLSSFVASAKVSRASA